MTQKSYVQGNPFPDLKPDTLRLYSMRFCPYAQRTRLVLAHKNLPFETINVSLKEKPDWFLERNPLGRVPVLEYNDRVIYESAICDDYLDEVYPEKRLTPTDPYIKARQNILKEHYSTWITNYYRYIQSHFTDGQALANMYPVLEKLDSSLGNHAFFGGTEPTMLDYHLWPWLERSGAEVFEGKFMPEGRFPNLEAWMKNMHQTEAVKATAFDSKTHNEFFKGYAYGKANYDIGLEEQN